MKYVLLVVVIISTGMAVSSEIDRMSMSYPPGGLASDGTFCPLSLTGSVSVVGRGKKIQVLSHLEQIVQKSKLLHERKEIFGILKGGRQRRRALSEGRYVRFSEEVVQADEEKQRRMSLGSSIVYFSALSEDCEVRTDEDCRAYGNVASDDVISAACARLGAFLFQRDIVLNFVRYEAHKVVDNAINTAQKRIIQDVEQKEKQRNLDEFEAEMQSRIAFSMRRIGAELWNKGLAHLPEDSPFLAKVPGWDEYVPLSQGE